MLLGALGVSLDASCRGLEPRGVAAPQGDPAVLSAETSSYDLKRSSEIGATSKEIAATSKLLLKTINDVTEGAEQTANLAGTGQNGLARMEATMRQAMEAGGDNR